MYSRIFSLLSLAVSFIPADAAELSGKLVPKGQDYYIGKVKIIPQLYDQFAIWSGRDVTVTGNYESLGCSFRITDIVPGITKVQTPDCGCGMGERCCCGKVCNCVPLAKTIQVPEKEPAQYEDIEKNGWLYRWGSDGWCYPVRPLAREVLSVPFGVSGGGSRRGGSC